MKHWLNNLEKAKSKNWKYRWYDHSWKSCKYCLKYLKVRECKGCPLSTPKTRCTRDDSPYSQVEKLLHDCGRVLKTTTQEQLIRAISEMVSVLEEVAYG